MIKRYLLKLAYKINKHYKTIEIKHEDYIKFNNNYFIIVQSSHSQEVGCSDVLDIKAYSIDYYLPSFKTNL